MYKMYAVLLLVTFSLMGTAYGDYANLTTDHYLPGDFLQISTNSHNLLTFDIENNDYSKSFKADPRGGTITYGIPFPDDMPYGVYDITFNHGNQTSIQQFGYNVLPPCVFTAYIEKNIVLTSEKPFVTGLVKNCDVENLLKSGNENWNMMKNSVYVRILDSNGDLVERIENSENVVVGRDHKQQIQDNRYLEPKFNVVSKFNFNDQVYREGSYTGNANIEEARTVKIQPDQFFFYLPTSINTLEFAHGETYTVELTYMKHTRTVDFLVIDTGYVEPDQSVECDNLRGLYNSMNVIEANFDSIINKPLIVESHESRINEIQVKINELETTCGKYNAPIFTKSTRDFDAASVYNTGHETMEEKRIKLLEAYALQKNNTGINSSNSTNPEELK